MSRSSHITRITVWGAVVNLLLTVLKMIAGIVGCSAAMVADAVHSLSDLVSDAVVLVMVRISAKGRDEDHDFGHGKYETLATLAIAVLLFVVGVELLKSGIAKIRFVALGGVLPMPGQVALWAALLSIVAKEVLYQVTVRVGRREDSQAVIANAWHHRSDALSSVGALVGIGGAMLFGGQWTVLDPVVSCLISIVIMVVSVQMALPALRELTDASLPEKEEKQIMSLIAAVEGVESVHNLKTRRSGPNYIIDAHIVVDPNSTVLEAHRVTIEVEKALWAHYGTDTQISLHVEPAEDAE
ncbi:MAG: cation diffusion facilitator family transporter [Paludibacteraceae bacterium]|nr:cation diffusion facilitator family transporter [Paludibacteraceae bacterium]